jgi:hypothetical protein
LLGRDPAVVEFVGSQSFDECRIVGDDQFFNEGREHDDSVSNTCSLLLFLTRYFLPLRGSTSKCKERFEARCDTSIHAHQRASGGHSAGTRPLDGLASVTEMWAKGSRSHCDDGVHRERHFEALASRRLVNLADKLGYVAGFELALLHEVFGETRL